MLVNVTDTRIVIGRINVLPGEKVPAVALTSKEDASIKRLVAAGYLAEKPGVHKSEAVTAPKQAEKSAEKPEKEKPGK